MDKVGAFATANSLPVNNIGFDFNEPASGAWLEFSIAPNDRNYGINDANVFRRGICQINVCNKKNNGIKQLLDIADLIETEFPLATVLLDSIRITASPKAAEPFQRGGVFVLQVSFEYSE
jgi:hypothetical protein